MAKKLVANEVPLDCLPMCKTCCYRRQDDDSDYSTCHRYPPTIVSDGDGSTYAFVSIDLADFCGEYRRQCLD